MEMPFSNCLGLTRDEAELYGRQILLPQIGVRGQRQLQKARVVIVGLGGLGSSAAMYLSAAGIGHLRLVDGDVVTLSNLHRQIIHDRTKVGQLKATSAQEACSRLNSQVEVEPVAVRLTGDNASSLTRDAKVVLDCTDNAECRYLLNYACARSDIPLIAGSALRWEGQLSVYCCSGLQGAAGDGSRDASAPKGISRGPCYQCIFPNAPETSDAGACDIHGVIGPAPGLIGVLQATEAIKICSGMSSESVLSQRLLLVNLLDPAKMFRSVLLRARRPHCPVCSEAALQNSRPHTEVLPRLALDALPDLPCQQRLSGEDFFAQYLELVALEGSPLKLLRVRQPSDSPTALTHKTTVLDVRRPNHVEALRVEGARHSPVAEITDRLLLLSRDSPVIQRETLIAFLKTGVWHTAGQADIKPSSDLQGTEHKLICFCRKGRDSARAVLALTTAAARSGLLNYFRIKSVDGGLLGVRAAIPALSALAII